jgi:transposase
MKKVFLGVDVSKAKIDVALKQADKIKLRVFMNALGGFTALMAWLEKNQVDLASLHICMEATGVYGEALANFLFEAGVMVSVVNPAQIKAFGKSALLRTKTDAADAQLIARFCEAMKPGAWQPKPKNERLLQAFVHHLESLKTTKQMHQNRLDVAPDELKEVIKPFIVILEQEIEGVKQKIKALIKSDDDMNTNRELLESIPGIGEETIPYVLAMVGDVKKFDSAKQVAAYAGLNPKQHQSGSSVRGRTHLSKIGNARLRKAFYMPAITAMRHNPVIKAFCDRLALRGKAKMAIVGAAMRKLLHMVYGVLKSKKPFCENPITHSKMGASAQIAP